MPDIPKIEDPDFSHYDEHFHILHPEFKGRDRIDYWTGYYSNRPALKSLIYRAFSSFHSTETLTNLAHLYAARRSSTLLPITDNPILSNRSTTPSPSTYLPRSELSAQLLALSHSVSIGLHHDTLPSTSRSGVHESETESFKEVIEASRQLLVREFLKILGADEKDIRVGLTAEYIVANEDRERRRQVMRF